MLTRRKFLQGGGSLAVAGTGFGGYGFAVEPYRLLVQHYDVRPRAWPSGMRLRLAALADLHACEPWMPVERVREIVAKTNTLGADIVVLLGDFVGGSRVAWGHYDMTEWADALAGLEAPLGVHAVLGNHDWWADREAQLRGRGPIAVRLALEAAGIAVYENDAVRLAKSGNPFWLCGLGSQWALYGRPDPRRPHARFRYTGVDDLDATIAAITDDAPALMMVHEPDIFAEMPARIAVTFAGHTHGGQVQAWGFAPIIPSRFGRRFLYGHIQEDDKHLIVSGGIGVSGLPVRFGRPPEVVVVDIEG